MMKNQKKKFNVIAVIPARGGSKGLKLKNIHPVDGMPLIAYTIKAAQNADLVQEIYVDTDHNEIAGVARSYGASIIERPPHLGGDFVTSDEVLKHTSQSLKSDVPTIIVYLQPTDIFRRRGIIDRVIQTLINNPSADSAFAAFPTHKNYWTEEGGAFKRVAERENLPRQKKKYLSREDTGIACATHIDTVITYGRIGNNPLIVSHDEPLSMLDIHTIDDIEVVEKLVREFKGTGKYEF